MISLPVEKNIHEEWCCCHFLDLMMLLQKNFKLLQRNCINVPELWVFRINLSTFLFQRFLHKLILPYVKPWKRNLLQLICYQTENSSTSNSIYKYTYTSLCITIYAYALMRVYLFVRACVRACVHMCVCLNIVRNCHGENGM